MAETLRDQEVPEISGLDFDDRITTPLETEVSHRNNRSYLAHLRRAQLRVRACVEDVD